MVLDENQVKLQLEEINKIRNTFPLNNQATSSLLNGNTHSSFPEKRRRVRDSGGNARNIYDSVKGFKNDMSHMVDLEPSVTITLQNNVQGKVGNQRMPSKRKAMFDAKAEMLKNEKARKLEEKRLKELQQKQLEEEQRKVSLLADFI